MRCVKGSDLLVDSLVRLGIDTVFGVPGDTGVAFYDALYSRQGEIRHVLARDERHAAYMADGFARVTGRVGAVEVSSGGGTTYVVGGLGEAFASGVPVLLLTSDIHTASRGTGALTEIDQEALFTAVTKWRTVVERAGDIPAAVDEAVSQAVGGRPGPVAVIIPENIYEEEVAASTSSVSALATDRLSTPADRQAAHAAVVASVTRALERAERPVMLVGSGVHASGAWAELHELAEKGGIPVATTIHGVGALADDDPWLLGTAGNNSGLDYVNARMAEADVVLLVGTRANATDTNSWRGPARDGATVAQIDVDPSRVGRNFPGSTALLGDARTVLAQLLAEHAGLDSDACERRREEVRTAREAWRTADQEAIATPTEDGQIDPALAVTVVRGALPVDGAILVADPGTPTPAGAIYWRPTVPGRTVIIPRGHGPMGYAIPAAVGAAFASPNTPVVSLTADGSFAMACGDLETVSRFNLPVLYLQFTNHSMGWIKMLQHLYTGERYFGVDPGTIDSVGVAVACGLEAYRVRTVEELRAVALDFSVNPRPVYVDIEVPHLIDRPPHVPAWDGALAGDPERPVY